MNNLLFGNYEIFIHEELDSTSSEARRLAERGITKNAVILAINQVNGKGRNGKIWSSSQGNFHCTIMLAGHELSKPEQSFFCLVTGVAVLEVINSLIDTSRYTTYLKWPNDIIINDCKLAGILLESIKLNDISYLLIGIGINIVYHPINIEQQAISLADLNVNNTTPQTILKKIISSIDKYIKLWQENGSEYIRKLWVEQAYKINEKIIFKSLGENIEGIFTGIKSNGDIIIEKIDKKLYNFNIGEVFNI